MNLKSEKLFINVIGGSIFYFFLKLHF